MGDAPLTEQHLAEISQRAERLAFLVPLGEAAANGRIIEVELKEKADFVDLGHLIGIAVPALLAEVDRLKALWAAVAKTSARRESELIGRRTHTEKLKAEVEQLTAQVAAVAEENTRLVGEVTEWRDAASYFEGPTECLERDCEEFVDDDGNDRPDVLKCSHITEKQLSPEAVGTALERTEGWGVL